MAVEQMGAPSREWMLIQTESYTIPSNSNYHDFEMSGHRNYRELLFLVESAASNYSNFALFAGSSGSTDLTKIFSIDQNYMSINFRNSVIIPVSPPRYILSSVAAYAPPAAGNLDLKSVPRFAAFGTSTTRYTVSVYGR